MKRLEKLLKKLLDFLVVSWYIRYYYRSSIKEHWVLLDSKNGKDLGSNLLRIAEELSKNPDYQKRKMLDQK